jgi:uncharacterized PurR-regulated membrane protein YhhQ (DUF165 family)
MRDFKKGLAVLSKQKTKIVALSVVGLTAAANAAVTLPVPDYSDIEAAAGIGFGIVLTVGLLTKAKRFFR